MIAQRLEVTMSKSTRADGGEDQQRDLWDRIGREVAANQLEDCEREVSDALYAIVKAMAFHGDDPTPEQVRNARVALNQARYTLEESIAPAAGCEQWGDPLPEMPVGRLQDLVEGTNINQGGETDE